MSIKMKLRAIVFNRLLLITVVMFATFILPSANEEVWASEPYIEAESAILIDASSGRILYEKNANEARPMASVTKITTAVVALEKGNLEDIVKISKRAAETGESSIWLEEGERHTLEELLFALMMRSANDSAVAIAEHIGGSVEEFAKMMSKRAKELGARNTNYVNPHGLHDPDHYTSAYDLAIITRYAYLNLPKFKELVTTEKRTMDWPSSEWDRVLVNQNKLLKQYQGADGVKTGFTDEAGKTFVGSATRNGRQLIAVVMKSPDIYGETATLLDYGFHNFNKVSVIKRNSFKKSLTIVNGTKETIGLRLSKDFTISLKKGEEKSVKITAELPHRLEAPVKKGDKVGQLKVKFKDKDLDTIDILAKESVDKKSLLYSLWQRVTQFFSNLFRFAPN